jgi:hypothetical protein
MLNNINMNQKIQAVMLPTEDKSHIINDKLLGLQYNSIPLDNSLLYNPQHLYTTVSQDVEPIKEGDWVYNSFYNEVYKFDKSIHFGTRSSNYKKIIATTDPKLLKEHDDSVPIPRMKSTGIAKLQQSFLKTTV